MASDAKEADLPGPPNTGQSPDSVRVVVKTLPPNGATDERKKRASLQQGLTHQTLLDSSSNRMQQSAASSGSSGTHRIPPPQFVTSNRKGSARPSFNGSISPIVRESRQCPTRESQRPSRAQSPSSVASAFDERTALIEPADPTNTSTFEAQDGAPARGDSPNLHRGIPTAAPVYPQGTAPKYRPPPSPQRAYYYAQSGRESLQPEDEDDDDGYDEDMDAADIVVTGGGNGAVYGLRRRRVKVTSLVAFWASFVAMSCSLPMVIYGIYCFASGPIPTAHALTCTLAVVLGTISLTIETCHTCAPCFPRCTAWRLGKHTMLHSVIALLSAIPATQKNAIMALLFFLHIVPAGLFYSARIRGEHKAKPEPYSFFRNSKKRNPDQYFTATVPYPVVTSSAQEQPHVP